MSVNDATRDDDGTTVTIALEADQARRVARVVMDFLEYEFEDCKEIHGLADLLRFRARLR
ncbi:MAG: hypothetical protein M3P40_08105 [Actinomycetota bacterium]|nr:hypothetical protein [Actinomycetota bacterium]